MDMCKRIQELILTDYLDDEINKESVDKHIASCKACREFLALAKKVTIEPLKNSKKNHLSQDVIWSRIQNEIKSEETYADEYDSEMSFFEKVKDMILSPKPAFAFGSFVVLILMVLVLNFNAKQSQLVKENQNKKQISVKEKIVVKTEEIDQELYLAYYLEQDEGYKNYGTSLEEYFL